MMGKPNFSLDDFKKWMKDNGNFSMERNRQTLEGTLIESKIPLRRLLEKITPEEGELNDLANEFNDNGGLIYEVNDTSFLVKVDSGMFYISRKYIRKG